MRTVARLRLAGAAGRCQAVRRGAQDAGRGHGRRLRGPGGRPPRRRPAGPGQADEARGRLPGRLPGDGPTSVDYRRLIEAKLTALGAAPAGAGRRGAGAAPMRLCVRRGAAGGAGWPRAGRPASTDKPKPTPLEDARAQDRRPPGLERASSASVGFPLVPAVRGGVFYVAAGDGDVLALQRRHRRRASGAPVPAPPLSAGVGSDGRFTSVVTRGNEVVTFEAGRELWRKRVPSRVVTPPLVAGERVFVMGVDRAVHAFDALDGRRLWTLQRPGDALTLAQAGVLAAFRNTPAGRARARAWPASTRCAAACSGKCRWPRRAAPTRSSAWPTWSARRCAWATVSAPAPSSRPWPAPMPARGALLWSRNVGGVQAVGGDAERVFGADASDRITAWRADNGDVAWTSEKLLYRGLSGAAGRGRRWWSSATARATCTSCRPPTGEPQLRLPHRRLASGRHAGAGRHDAARRHRRRRPVRLPPELSPHDEAGHRHRRPAQRRQVDAVQPHHEEPRRHRRRLRRPDARPPLRRRAAGRARVHRRRHRRLRARQAHRHRRRDGQADAAGGGRGRRGDLRRRRARRPVGAGPRHRALPAHAAASACCWRRTRPRAWSSRRCWASSTNSAWATPHPISSAHGQGIRSLLEAALEDFPEDEEAGRRGRADAGARSGWPWPAGRTSARAR